MDDYKSCNVIIREISAYIYEIKETMNASDIIFFNADDSYVYSAYLNTKKTVKYDKLTAELFTVGDILNERLYSQTNSIVFTSATLATADSFKSFKDAVGLDDDTRECQLNSSFDYDNNMTIYIANDMPDPNGPTFVDRLSDFLCDLHIAGNGSILSLFTNRRQMENAHAIVSESIKNAGLRLLMQK